MAYIYSRTIIAEIVETNRTENVVFFLNVINGIF